MSDDELDISWINEQKRILDIQQNYLREHQTSIAIHFCYINNDLVEKIHNETYTFIDASSTTISTTELKNIIEKQQTNYVFDSLLVYVVDIEPEKIGSFSENTDFAKYNITTITTDITIPPSVFIFHPINCIFIVLKPPPPKSCIKKQKNLTKKRVSFHNKTKKNA